MTVAIMQPYLFPYLGYWQLIHAVDTFVIYDNIQFSKKGWFHRNNILLNEKKTLFTLPIKKDSDTLNVVERYIIENSDEHIKKILAQILNAYNKAPFFESVFPMLEEILWRKEKNLFAYIHNSILKINEYLEIDTKIIFSSKINIDHTLKSQNKVLAISQNLGAKIYINPIGGMALYNSSDFKKNGIDLFFLESDIPKYRQFSEEFIPYLSIIDIMMFNSKGTIRNMLEQYKLKKIDNV